MKHFFRYLFIFFNIFILDLVINSDRVQLDGKLVEIKSLFFHSDTEYSKNYTSKKFSEVKIGMTESEVIEILGEPLSKFKPHKDSGDPKLVNHLAFQYSYSPSKSHFRVRNIIFDHGKVIKKIHCFDVID